MKTPKITIALTLFSAFITSCGQDKSKKSSEPVEEKQDKELAQFLEIEELESENFRKQLNGVSFGVEENAANWRSFESCVIQNWIPDAADKGIESCKVNYSQAQKKLAKSLNNFILDEDGQWYKDKKSELNGKESDSKSYSFKALESMEKDFVDCVQKASKFSNSYTLIVKTISCRKRVDRHKNVLRVLAP